MNIRELRESDHEALRERMRELQTWERRFDARLADPDDEAVLERLMRDTLEACAAYDGRIFVAEAGGELAGYVGVLARVPRQDVDEVAYTYALISDVAVAPAWRAQGIGTALLAHAEAFARARGAHWLRIQVLGRNRRAWRLYRRAGFDEREVVLEKRLQ